MSTYVIGLRIRASLSSDFDIGTRIRFAGLGVSYLYVLQAFILGSQHCNL